MANGRSPVIATVIGAQGPPAASGPFSVSPPPTSGPGKHTPAVCHCRVLLPFPEVPMNGIAQDVLASLPGTGLRDSAGGCISELFPAAGRGVSEVGAVCVPGTVARTLGLIQCGAVNE